MPNISFTENLNRHLSCHNMMVSGNTLGEAMQQVFQVNPRLKSYLMTDQQQFRQHVLVAIDGKILLDKKLETPLAADSDIFIAQALSGG